MPANDISSDGLAKPGRQSKSSSIVALAAIGLSAAALLLLVMFARRERVTSAEVPLPDRPVLSSLSLQPLTGESPDPLTLDNLHGQVTLINLWGPWCAACRVELSHLASLQQRFAGTPGFRLVSVTCGPDLAREQLDPLRAETLAYLRDAGLSFPLFADPGGQTRRALVAAARLDGQGLGYPANVLLDREGRIQRLWIGYASGLEQELADAIENLLPSAGHAGDRQPDLRGRAVSK